MGEVILVDLNEEYEKWGCREYDAKICREMKKDKAELFLL
jgi:hypothetical protein